MGETTKIQWCDHTFNPWRGCTRVHTGCVHCYAETLSKRNPGTLGLWGPEGTRVVASEQTWMEPLAWNRKAAAGECPDCNGGRKKTQAKPYGYEICETCRSTGHVTSNRRRVFCASLADVFEAWPGMLLHSAGIPMWLMHDNNGHPNRWGAGHVLDVPSSGRPLQLDDVRHRLFGLIDDTPSLGWLLVTKRPENVRRMWPRHSYDACATGDCPHDRQSDCGTVLDRDNVWLLTSVSDQPTADQMIPPLLECRDLVPVLGLSIEPLLGPIDLSPWLWRTCSECGGEKFLPPEGRSCNCARFGQRPGFERSRALDWVIIGGESGPHARPCDVEWVRQIIRQCHASGVPVFVKQLGARPILNAPVLDEWPDYVHWAADKSQQGFRLHGLKDPKGGDPDEWPEDLRFREFPVAGAA